MRNVEILQTRIFVEITHIISVTLVTNILFSLIYTAFSWKHKIVILENIVFLALKYVGQYSSLIIKNAERIHIRKASVFYSRYVSYASRK